MGANTSRGRDNQSLIDSLISNDHSLPPRLERVLRLVDRGDYFGEKSGRAYIDLAWRSNSLHLSAPSIYLVAMKNLDIEPGQHFLNVGSGSGYFNTVIGLLLGYNGINHGIEMEESNVEFAKKCLWSFLNESDAPFEMDFCVPQFVHGNIFDVVVPRTMGTNRRTIRLSNASNEHSSSSEDEDVILAGSQENIFPTIGDQPNTNPVDNPLAISEDRRDVSNLVHGNRLSWPLYDRIYVGAGVQTRVQLQCIMSLLKIGGMMVAPVQDEFVKLIRVSENRMVRTNLLSVSFAPLIMPETEAPNRTVSHHPRPEVYSLLKQCGRYLRRHLRACILEQHGALPVLGRVEEVKLVPRTKKPCNAVNRPHEAGRIKFTGTNGDRETLDEGESEVRELLENTAAGDYSSKKKERADTHSSEFDNDSGASSTDELPPSRTTFAHGSLARVLHHLISRSTLLATEQERPSGSVNANSGVGLLPDPEPTATRDQEDGENVSAERVAEEVMAIIHANDSSDSETAEEDDDEEEEEDNDVGDQEQEEEQGSDDPASTHNPMQKDGAARAVRTCGEDGLDPEDDASEHSSPKRPKRQLKRVKPKREFQYHPPSYRFRTEMHRILSDELHLPNTFIRAAFMI